jgi:hypothetical protein
LIYLRLTPLIESFIIHDKGKTEKCHSREGGNPGTIWIPGSASRPQNDGKIVIVYGKINKNKIGAEPGFSSEATSEWIGTVSMSGTQNNTCPRCGAGFVCGMQAEHASCWCAELPTLLKMPDTPAACYCPACLGELLAARRSGEVPADS